MRTMKLGKTNLEVPVLALGCMRLAGADRKQAAEFVSTALDLGLNFFDHADIYGGGKCESVFADIVKELNIPREKLLIQSKCGIVPGKMFDFSKKHILEAADGILSRLDTDYLDVLLLHRPDALMEPDEVAEAFNILEDSGKVRHFGVSNHNPMQIALLNKYLGEDNPVLINQLQFSLTNTTMIDSGLNVNMENGAAVNRDDSVLDYCRLHDITIQPWSPFQYGFFEGCFIDNPKFPKLNEVLRSVAARYNVTPTGMAIAWILRHPAKMQPIIGSVNIDRIRQIAAASDVTITHDEWYELYRSTGKTLP